jgi:hypothetical protein
MVAESKKAEALFEQKYAEEAAIAAAIAAKKTRFEERKTNRTPSLLSRNRKL